MKNLLAVDWFTNTYYFAWKIYVVGTILRSCVAKNVNRLLSAWEICVVNDSLTFLLFLWDIRATELVDKVYERSVWRRTPSCSVHLWKICVPEYVERALVMRNLYDERRRVVDFLMFDTFFVSNEVILLQSTFYWFLRFAGSLAFRHQKSFGRKMACRSRIIQITWHRKKTEFALWRLKKHSPKIRRNSLAELSTLQERQKHRQRFQSTVIIIVIKA